MEKERKLSTPHFRNNFILTVNSYCPPVKRDFLQKRCSQPSVHKGHCQLANFVGFWCFNSFSKTSDFPNLAADAD